MTQITSHNRAPTIEEQQKDNGGIVIKLSGNWNLRYLNKILEHSKKISRYAKTKSNHWDLDKLNLLDSAAALIIWQAWEEQFPDHLIIRPEHKRLLTKWQEQKLPSPANVHLKKLLISKYLIAIIGDFMEQLLEIISLLGQLVLDCFHLLLHPREIPWAEISITIYEAGVRALGITALVGFLIGIVLSYLSALQLKMFGAEIYIIDILGLSIIRELGPLLAAILVAGRSGSAMTAQIGIMRVTEELDALASMGISHSLRLVLPKVLALTVALPLLSVWTNASALLGGMFAAQNTLDISVQQFFFKLPDAVPIVNLFIGLLKSAVFGLMIAVIACHFGFRIKPNTESLGNETTNSVVTAITVVIMIDALFAILFMGIGMPMQ